MVIRTDPSDIFVTLKHSYNSGILRDKTMADKLMYNPNDNTQNYLFYMLEQVVKMFGHSTS